jgi:hypothetical protein
MQIADEYDLMPYRDNSGKESDTYISTLDKMLNFNSIHKKAAWHTNYNSITKIA